MVDEEAKSIDVAEELKDRFLGAYFWYLEGMEFAPGFKLSVESEAAAVLFEALHDSVDAIPQELIASTAAVRQFDTHGFRKGAW
jgi:hypothetical protein